jgi:hypothetical protein
MTEALSALLELAFEKLEINLMDDRGKIIPFSLFNIVNYDVLSNDGKGYDSMKNASLDIHVYSTSKARDKEPVEKIRVEIFSEA